MGVEDKTKSVVKVAMYHRVGRSESAEKMTLEEQKAAAKQIYEQMSEVKAEQDEVKKEEDGMIPQM